MTDIVRVFHATIGSRSNGLVEMNERIEAFLKHCHNYEVKETKLSTDGSDVLVAITLTTKKVSPC